MSTELTKGGTPASPRYRFSRNTMSFPRELREAIPDLPTCVGRVLELDAISSEATNRALFGPHVHLKFVVKETGKLKGEFTVGVSLQVESARALAATLTQLADQAEKMDVTPF